MFYKETPDLLLLKIRPDKLTADIKDELGDVIAENFPHLYGKLNLDAVESAQPYPLANDGHYPQIID